MSKILQLVRERIANRPDTEHEQAIVRVALALAVFAYLSPRVLAPEFGRADLDLLHVGVMAGYLLNAAIILRLILGSSAQSPLRRIYGACGDIAAVTFFLYFAGEHGLPLVLLYIWIAIANGFRFGAKYLTASLALAGVGFSFVLYSGAYWSEHRSMGGTFLVGMVILLLYVLSLVRKLFDAIARAESANLAKRRFVSVISHEMRTPLNAIINLNGLLAQTPLKRDQKELVDTVGGASQVMLQLVNDVLDFSKIEAGKLQLEETPFDLHGLVNSTCRLFRGQSETKGLRLHTTIMPEVPHALTGDPHHLRQILLNLMGNAIKFTERGYVAVEVSVLTEDAECVRIRFAVRDTGVGISRESLARVFESFGQAEASTTRRFGGTGLGTTIAKQLVEMMGGKIGVESSLGAGSTFWFEIPCRKTRLDESSAPQGARAGKVVLAGFSAQMQRPLVTLLSRSGYSVEPVRDIDAVVKQMTPDTGQLAPSCVLAYAGIGANAQAVAARYYGATSGSRAPLILCTDQMSPSARSVCLAVGYASIVVAPWDEKLVLNAVRSAIATEPIMRAPAAGADASASQSTAPGDRGPYRILVADDTPVNLVVAKAILERAGHTVVCVASGDEGLDVLQREDFKFDIALLDFHMPGADGVETTKSIRLLMRGDVRYLPVVILTADVTLEARAESLAAGADAILGKPIETEELLSVIRELCVARVRVGDHTAAGRGGRRLNPLEGGRTVRAGPPTSSASSEIDRDALVALEQLGVDRSFTERLIAGYLRDTATQVTLAERAAEEGNVGALREALHAIKGSSGSIGAVGMVQTCTALRAGSDDEMRATSKLSVPALVKSFEDTRAALEKYLEERARPVSTSSESSE